MKKVFRVFLVILLIISIGFNICFYKQIKGIEVDLQLLQEEKATIENSISEKDTTIAEKDNKIEELQTTIEGLQQEIEALKEQISSIESEKAEINEELETVKKEIEEVEQKGSEQEQSSTVGGAGSTTSDDGGGHANIMEDPTGVDWNAGAEKFGLTDYTGTTVTPSGYDGPPLF